MVAIALGGCTADPAPSAAADAAAPPEAPSSASALAAPERALDASSEPTVAALPLGAYRGRGVWGVHSTGALTVEVNQDGCVARYDAQGSYFCVTRHRLRCSVQQGGAEALVEERACMMHCSHERGGAQSCAVAAGAGVNGTLRATAEGGWEFVLADAVVASRKQWSQLRSLPMQR